VLVLTGNSRDEGTTPEEVAEDLIRIMGDAVAASIPES
jgi:hypothetical protein